MIAIFGPGRLEAQILAALDPGQAPIVNGDLNTSFNFFADCDDRILRVDLLFRAIEHTLV